MEKFMTKEFAPGLALDTGEFIPASDLNAQTAAPQVQKSATKGSRTGDIEMTDKEQPTALHLAELLESEVDDAMERSAVELRRQYAEIETLRTGYAAARLEIESLNAQLHAAKQSNVTQFWLFTSSIPGSALRASHWQAPAGATDQLAAVQSIVDDVLRVKGAAENWGGWSATGDVCDLIVTKLHTVSAMWRRRNADFQRVVDQCARLAATSTPTAQATPAAVAGCTRSHPHENMDSACRAKAAIAEMQNMAARGAEATAQDLERFVSMLAAAPTTQAAPQQEAQEPVAGQCRFPGVVWSECSPEHVRMVLANPEEWKRYEVRYLYTAPQPSPAAQGDALDAARYRWLAASCRSTSEHWGGRWSIIIDGPAPKSHDSEDDFDAAIDAARAAQEDK